MDTPTATEAVAVASVLALGATRIVLAIRWLWLCRATRVKDQINT